MEGCWSRRSKDLGGVKGEIVAGKGWNDVIDSAERFIRRHGGQGPHSQ